jgi:hypothetical protein
MSGVENAAMHSVLIAFDLTTRLHAKTMSVAAGVIRSATYRVVVLAHTAVPTLSVVVTAGLHLGRLAYARPAC